jgi:site-specific recombinase XerD
MRRTDEAGPHEPAGTQSLEDHIADYLRHLRYGAGCSKSTFKAYQSQLRRFVRWLRESVGHPPRLNDVTARNFRNYIVELMEQGLRPRTVRSAAMPVRSLFNYLLECDVLDSSPVHAVRLPKKDAAQRPRVLEEELLALPEGCDRLAGLERSCMAKALILLLITAMIRRSELLATRVQDVNLEAGQLLVASGKGGKSRSIFLPDDARAALAAWLRSRPACDHDYLFIVDKHRRLGNEGLNTLLEEVKAAAGLRGHDHIQPHAIRHAAATRVHRRGADLRSLQTMLGHANIATTAIYLHADEERLRLVAGLASVASPEPPAAPTPPQPEKLSVSPAAASVEPSPIRSDSQTGPLGHPDPTERTVDQGDRGKSRLRRRVPPARSQAAKQESTPPTVPADEPARDTSTVNARNRRPPQTRRFRR